MRSFSVCLLVLPAALLSILPACSTDVATDDEDTTAGAASVAGLTLPEPGSTENRISPADQATIVAAFKEAKNLYYDTQNGYGGYKDASNTVKTGKPSPAEAPAVGEIASVPCVANQSELVCHFYKHMPSYKNVIPNVRGCFSYLGNPQTGLKIPDSSAPGGSRPAVYPEVWDYCMHQPYDAVLHAPGVAGGPPYSAATIASNKAAGTELGTLRFLPKSIRTVFQFIMYTWYEPRTFAQADQDAILTAVYGSLPPRRPGLATHPSAPVFIPLMKAYFKGNYALGGGTSSSAAPTPVTPTTPPPPPPLPLGTNDATCRAMTTRQACSTCCDAVHKSAYQPFAKPLAACLCAPTTCATQCAGSVCATPSVAPTPACQACISASTTCRPAVATFTAACGADASCKAEQACFTGCNGKP